MTCDERRRLMAAGIVSTDDIAHIEVCEMCAEALIFNIMRADANALFETRQLYRPNLLIWKAKIREEMRPQASIDILGDIALLWLYLSGLLAAVAVWILLLMQYRPGGSLIWFFETYPLSSTALCFLLGVAAMAVGLASREMVNSYIFLARPALFLRRDYQGPVVKQAD